MSSTISLEQELERYFGYSNFRVGQKEIITDILSGQDVLGILPTGSGKSICYQLPARLLRGTTVVVSPLISLMMDQVKELKATNFKDVVALNSFIDFETRKNIYHNLHRYKLIYVSPEILQQKELQFQLSKLTVDLFVIDEAHCISQWGHEFRPDYQKLNQVIDILGNPTVLALSATATKQVQVDIMESLQIPHMKNHIYPMDRQNIILSIQEVSDKDEKLTVIQTLLSKYKVPSLVYFSSKSSAESVSRELSLKLPNLRVAFYHGGMEQMDRIAIQQQFMNDQIDVVCCTSAFGMGINKNNVRIVIHYHFPGQIESYIQEIGRAGRDGEESLSVLLYSEHDYFIPNQMIQSELPSDEDIHRVFSKLGQYNNGNKLPGDKEEIEAAFEISETQWRFITSQLEKNSVNIQNGLKYDQSYLEDIIRVIKNIRNERLEEKNKKLQEMIFWINSKDCLRKTLYSKFQVGFKKPLNQCCSNCGINLSEFQPKQTLHSKTLYGWEKKLKSLLLGEKNETK